MKRTNLIILLMCAVTFAFVSSCATPDSEAEFDEYAAIVGEGKQLSADLCPSIPQDISGTYFMRLQHTVLPQNNIIMMELTATKEGDGTYTLVFQPLKTDLTIPAREPRSDARAPVGDPITVKNVKMDENGAMEITLTKLTVAGDANPGTGTPITATIDMQIVACAKKEGFICGKASLDVFAPLHAENKAATFGAVKTEEITKQSTAPVNCAGDTGKEEEK